jgi:hypothetical protein
MSAMKSMKRLIALPLVVMTFVAVESAQPQFDVLIRNARVMDGSGNPWIRADLGITGDRITAVGALAAPPPLESLTLAIASSVRDSSMSTPMPRRGCVARRCTRGSP